jgi:hypothetical protein
MVLYLGLKGMNGGEIDDDLVTTLPDDAPAYSTVSLWLGQERPRHSERGHDLSGDRQVDETDQAILSAFTIQPFGSMRDIVRLTCLSCSTVHLHLTRSLGFRVRHLRWISSVLTHEQKLDRVGDLQACLKILQAKQKRSWYDIVTRDEPWFFSALSMNEYGLLREKPHLIESVTRFNLRNAS